MVLLVACSAPKPVNNDSQPDDSQPDDSQPSDSGLSNTPPSSWGPTEGVLDTTFSIGGVAQGTTRLGAVTLGQNIATFTLNDTPHTAVVWLDHDWSEAGYHLYDLLSVADDGSALAVTWLYAQGDAGAINVPYAYTESYGLPMDWEYASGALDVVQADTEQDVWLPALTALPPPIDTGFEISGDLQLSASGGSVTLDGVTRTVHPLGLVDCSDCPGGPWYEVHLVLAGDDACFSILYLFPNEPTQAQLEYGLCLPTLERLSAPLELEWSGSPNTRRGPPRGAPVRGVPPPRRLEAGGGRL